jgi:hypothetical protein
VQILTKVQLDEAEHAAAITILEHNLDTSSDWIVTNLTLQALATFARTSPAVRTRLNGCITTRTAPTSRSRHDRRSCWPS